MSFETTARCQVGDVLKIRDASLAGGWRSGPCDVECEERDSRCGVPDGGIHVALEASSPRERDSDAPALRRVIGGWNHQAGESGLRRGERLIDVFEDVVNRLDTNTETDHVGRHTAVFNSASVS